MRVFVTGATGFVGSAVVRELLAAGHQVVGLARSEPSAAALATTGAEVRRGVVEDLDVLRDSAAAADGVIHTAFNHDFSRFAASAEADRIAIEAMGEVLVGTEKPFVVTSGLAGLANGGIATEDERPDPQPNYPRRSEHAAMAFADRGVRVSVVRLAASVHGEGDRGFVPGLIQIARESGVAGYPGDGRNRWPAVHRFDAAQLYRLALESAPAGARLHGVSDEGVPLRELADVIGRHLGLPVASVPVDHFGWLAPFVPVDIPASSAQTQKRLGWHPVQIGLLADLEAGHYFSS